MFHYKKDKNFCKKFADHEIILIGNDIGPMRCFENISTHFFQKKFKIYFQSSELKDYTKNTVINFSLIDTGLTSLLFKITFCRSCEIIILQSSYVSFLEKLVVKLNSNVYVLQDFKNDYKFGVGVKYMSFFDSIPNIKFKDTVIYVLDGLRPKIYSHISNLMDGNLLLIIGAKNLLRLDGCMDFFETVLEFSKIKNLEVCYKPHPAENIDIHGIDFFHSKGVKLIFELPINKLWPKFIVSPHSSLGYDIPESVSLAKDKKFKILHSFGKQYDENMFLYPGFEEMTSSKSINYNISQIQEFFQ